MNQNPGNQDQQLNVSDQSSPTHSDQDSNQIVADKVEDQENQPLQDFMLELAENEMPLLDRLAIAQDVLNSGAESKPVDVGTKPEPEQVKKARAQKKAQKSSESSYAEHSEKLQKEKEAIRIINRSRGRPKVVQVECKLSGMVEAILQNQVKDATLMISTVTSLLKSTIQRDEATSAEALRAFYDYLDRIAYPVIHLCFKNEGNVPDSEYYRFRQLKPEDYIYLVYKYVQDNEIDGQLMHKIRDFAHTKFRTMVMDFDMSIIPI